MYAVLLWYGVTRADQPSELTIAIIALTSLGVTYGGSVALFRVAGEIWRTTVVIAEFLNQHLLEPLKERQREEGRKEGREEGREEGRMEGRKAALAAIRKRLAENGLNPDDYLPAEESHVAE